MPGILMRLPEIARALAYGGRDGYRIICMVDENVREQLGQPPLNGIWVAFYKRADPKDRCVPLAEGVRICGVPAVGEGAVLGEANKTFLRARQISVSTDN